MQSTIISYQLPVESKISLKIYDVSGRILETLVNEVGKPGSYKVNLNAKNLSTGIYFAELSVKSESASGGKVGNYKETKKIILMK